MLRRASVLLGLAGVFLLSLASPASALVVPSTVQSHYRDVADFVQRNGATATIPTPANPTVVDDLWLSEHRPMPNQVSSDALNTELRALSTKAKVLPRLSSAGAVGTITLAATVGYIGWQIGTGIRQKWLGLDAPASAPTFTGPLTWTVNSTKLNAVDTGDCIISVTATGCTNYKAPGEGFRVTVNATMTPGSVTNDYRGPFGSPAGCSAASVPPQDILPATAQLVVGTPPDPPFTCSGGAPNSGVYRGAWIAPKVKKPIVPYDGQAVGLTSPAPADVPADTAQQRVTDELENNPNNYPTLIPWLDNQLGGPSADPTASTVVIPTPLDNELYTAYAARLTTAGLTATRVDNATADPNAGPNVVTGVSPAQGTKVNTGTNVTVKTNAASAPAVGGGSMPDIPSINFSPLMVAGTCTNFPFGIPCWIYSTVSNFVGTPVTPSISFHFPYGGDGDNTTIDMHMFDPYMGTIRTLIGIGIMGSMIWLFYGLAFGGAVGGGRDDGSR